MTLPQRVGEDLEQKRPMQAVDDKKETVAARLPETVTFFTANFLFHKCFVR